MSFELSFENLEIYQQWVQSLPPALQWLAVIFLGMVPYVEIHFAAIAGIVSGINPAVSIPLAMFGNFIIVLLCVLLADKFNSRFGKDDEKLSPKRQKFNKNFEKYGVIGTSLFGWLVLPSSITSFFMITAAKVSKQKVILWMGVSIITWGTILAIVVLLFNTIII